MLATMTRADDHRPRSRPTRVALVLVALAILAVGFTVDRLTAGDGGPVAELTGTEVPAEIRAQWPAWAELEPIAPGQWLIPGTSDVYVARCDITSHAYDPPAVMEWVFVTVSVGQDCGTFTAGEAGP